MLFVSLYTSRIILKTLGVDDFGIYSVITALVALMGFINTSISASMLRFFSMSIGRNDTNDLHEKFNVFFFIQLIQCLILFFSFEFLGSWLVGDYLNIPDTRTDAAMVVLRFVLIASLFGVIKSPFSTLIIAKEKMGVFARFSIIEALIKLFLVYLLTQINVDKLILHSFLMMLLTFLIAAVYAIYCNKQFPESSFVIVRDFNAYKSVLNFSSWSAIGNLSYLLRLQGSSILLNMFFGVVVNAAYGIFLQVMSLSGLFVSSFMQAVNPQIVKAYANDRLDVMHESIFFSSRLSFYLVYILALPLFLMADLILNLWLYNVPEFTSVFVKIGLINILLDALARPIGMSVDATGKIKWYQITLAAVSLLLLPLSYTLFLADFPPQVILYVSVLLSVILMVVRLCFLKYLVKLNFNRYARRVLLPVSLVSISSFFLSYILLENFAANNSITSTLIATFMVGVITTVSIFTLGINQEERYRLLKSIRSKLQVQIG